MPTNPDRLAPAWGSDEHRAVLRHALTRVRAAEDAHNRMVPAWQENYRAFRAMPARGRAPKREDWQSDVRTPYIAEQVLTLLPRLTQGRPSIDVMRQSPEVSPEVARAQRQYLQHVLWQDGFPLKSARWALNDLLFGVGWSKQSYLHTVRTRDVVDRTTGRHVERPLTTASRPTMSIGHPYDVMADPTAPVLETARFVVWRTLTTVKQVHSQRRRRVRTKDGVERWAGRYENVEHVKPFGRGRDFILPNTVELPEHVNARCGDGSVELLEVFDNELDHLFVIANRQVVVRSQRMPWWHGEMPVSCAVTTPDVGVLHGIAEVDWQRPLQSMLHKLENQKLDNQRLQMDLVLLIRDTVMDMDDFQLGPGAKWPVQNMDDVQVLQYPQPQLASAQDLEMLRGRLQGIAGTGYMTGGDTTAMGVSQDTASGLMSIIEEGNRRVDFRMMLMEIGYERALQQMLSDGGQFLEDPMYVPGATRNGDPIAVSPEELAAKAWVRVRLGSETGMKSLRQQMAQNMAQVAQLMVGTPIPTPEGIKEFNPYPIVEAWADAYDREPEEWLWDGQQAAAAVAPTDPAAILAAQQQAASPFQIALPQGIPPAALPAGPSPAAA